MRTPARSLGKTGIKLNAIGLGSMPLSLEDRPPKNAAIEVIHKALEAGMNFIDTADVYCLDDKDIGYCERLIAEALQTWQGEKPFVATKGGLQRPKGAWVTNGTPTHLKAACEASLKALNVNCIELYQLHAADDNVPYAESIGALQELQKAGKIRHIGISNVSLEEIKIAQQIVEVVSVQNRCNPFDLRSFHNGVVAYCEKEAITFIPWSPVGGSPEKHYLAKHPLLTKVGKNHQASPFQVALAWLLAISPCLLPIPGASKIESAISSARAMDLNLSKEEIMELNKEFGL